MPEPTVQEATALTLLDSYMDNVVAGTYPGSKFALGEMPKNIDLNTPRIPPKSFDSRRNLTPQDWTAPPSLSRSNVRPTFKLTDLQGSDDDWQVGGIVGVDATRGSFSGGVDVGVSASRDSGVLFKDLKARLGYTRRDGRRIDASARLIGEIQDPRGFEGSLSIPAGKGNLALTGGVPFGGDKKPHVNLTYRRPLGSI